MPSLRAALSSSVATQGVATAVAIVSVPLYLSAFGRSVYGFWASLLGITGYLTLINFGITQAVSMHVSTSPSAQRAAGTRLAVVAGLREYARICAVALPVAAIACAFVPWAALFRLPADYAAQARYAALAIVIGMIVELPFTIFRAALYGMGEIAIERAITTATHFGRLGAAWSFARWQPPLWIAAAALLALTIAGHLACLHFVRRSTGPLLKPAPPPDSLPALRRSGAYFLVLHVGAMLVWNADTIVVGLVLGADAAAPVAIAWRVQLTALALAGLVAESIAPGLTQRWADGAHATAARLALSASQVTVAGVGLLLLCLLSGGRTLFHYWTGDDTFVGGTTWALYCALMLVQAYLIIPHHFVVQAGQHERYALWAIAEGTLKIPVAVVLVQWIGIAALPLTTIAGRLVLAGPPLGRAFTSAMHIGAGNWLRVVSRPLVFASPAFLAVFLAGRSLGATDTHAGTVVVTAAAGLAFGLCALGVGFDADTKAALGRMLGVARPG
jgi:O-antigen/teichoic acid export membrane protein